MTGSVKHDLVVGAEIYQETQKTPSVSLDNVVRSQASYDVTNPGITTATGSYTTNGYSKDATATGLAAYLSNTATLNDKLQLAGGVRLEKYKIDSTQNVGRGSSATSVSAVDKSDLISWHTAINFKPANNGSIYASFANNQEPNGNNLSLNGRSAEQVAEYASLDPIESITAEVGTKWELFDEKLLLAAAVFQTNKDVYQTVDNVLEASGEQESKGVELSATGQLTDTVSITASYTHQNAKVTEAADRTNRSGEVTNATGNGLSSAPKDSAAVWLSYQGEKLGLGLGAEYNSGNEYWRQNRVYFTTGGVTLVNAMASYAFTENLSAQLNISNLTDERYASDYSAKGHFLPGNPRNIKASVKYDF
jgi:catecholate siderophore receptor